MIGFSSFGVLLYYAVANAAAFTQPAGTSVDGLGPSVCSGLLGCVVLAVTLPPTSAVGAAVVLALALAMMVMARSGRGGSARS